MRQPLLGAHISAAGGHSRSFERARKLGVDCLQIFTRAPSAWAGKALDAEGVRAFRQARREAGNPPVLAHDLYLTNLASRDPEVYRKSVSSLIEEVRRCHELGLDGLVMHLGAHLGQGEEEGLARFSEGLRGVLSQTPPLPVLLETTAGQGTCLGHRFEHLARVLDHLRADPRVGVCLDTCHAHAAGYDLRTARGYSATWTRFERLLGMDRLRALHLNDSRTARGSRIDRHANIGEGMLGRMAFRRLVQDPRLAGLPMILETPRSETMHAVDLALLRQLAQERPAGSRTRS